MKKKHTSEPVKGNREDEMNETKARGIEISSEDEVGNVEIEKPTVQVQDSPEVLRQQVNDANDKFLRLYSEFDNYRKRTLKEKAELSKTASEDLIVSMLPVVDDFERALLSMHSLDKDSPYHQGVQLIYTKLMNILLQKGLEPMKSVGETFNTDFHDAITKIPASDDSMKGKVVDEIEKGYFLNGKVIRFAKVVVGE